MALYLNTIPKESAENTSLVYYHKHKGLISKNFIQCDLFWIS